MQDAKDHDNGPLDYNCTQSGVEFIYANLLASTKETDAQTLAHLI